MSSTRFPGKPLAPIEGVPMVTVQKRIKNKLRCICLYRFKRNSISMQSYIIKSIITSSCNTGTDRLALACEQIETDFVINLQGDEPLIDYKSINKIIDYIPCLYESKDLILNGITLLILKRHLTPIMLNVQLFKIKKKFIFF